MKKNKIPETDSIQELAHFWDAHDLTDFEDQLEEVRRPVFLRKNVLKINLEQDEVDAVNQIARSRGIPYDELIREWVRERIHVKRV